MIMKNMRIILAVTILSFVTTNVYAAKPAKDIKKEDVNTYEMLNLFGEILEAVKMSYVEEVSDKDLIESAINGMLSSLDPHSGYLDEQSFKNMTEQTKGKFGGLGIEVTMDSGLVKVVSPIDDTPAFRAGIKSGDYITDIDGKSVIGLTLSEAVEKMRGKPGTKIKLIIRRTNEKPFDVTLKREEIKIQSVKNETFGDEIIYIRISSFNETTDKMVIDAINKNKAKLKNNLKGIVIDVRNNPGGLLDQAINVSDLFLEEGEIVSTRSRNEADTIKFNAKEGDIAKNLPIVVLINNGSASASEILAGALQDHKRAIIMGEKSFGKGSVQTVVPLGKNNAMRFTTARYYTPSGTSIQGKGIEPDVEVKPSKIEVIENNFNISEADLKNSLKNTDSKNKVEKAKEIKAAEDKKLQEDYQLMRAIDLVKSLALYKSYNK